MTQLEVIESVATELKTRGYRATFEYPGFIEVLIDNLRIDFGTANETWDGDVYASESDGVVNTSIPSDSQDITVIADALQKAIESCVAPEVEEK